MICIFQTIMVILIIIVKSFRQYSDKKKLKLIFIQEIFYSWIVQNCFILSFIWRQNVAFQVECLQKLFLNIWQKIDNITVWLLVSRYWLIKFPKLTHYKTPKVIWIKLSKSYQLWGNLICDHLYGSKSRNLTSECIYLNDTF